MNETDDTRRREDAAIRLETQFKDFLEVYKADKEASAAWRIQMENRVNPLVHLSAILTTPAKIIGVVVVLMITPILGVCGMYIFKWAAIEAHRIAMQQ